jgi:hypothetical protein
VDAADRGEPILVYERVQSGKRQLFALAPDGSGLGRVYDSRYPRYCPGEVKFPLGYWKEGEVRDYRLSCDGGRSTRTLRVTIEAIDFTYGCVAHSLRFHWLMDEGRGRGTNMHYTYSPRLGLVYLRATSKPLRQTGHLQWAGWPWTRSSRGCPTGRASTSTRTPRRR